MSDEDNPGGINSSGEGCTPAVDDCEDRKESRRAKDEVKSTDGPMGDTEWRQFRDDRRRMAWLSLLSIFAVTGVALFYLPLERLEKLDDIISWFYMTTGSIVAAYYGFKTWAQIKKKTD